MNSTQSVSEIGEFALIQAIGERLRSSETAEVIVGLGDDSAVTKSDGRPLVSCVDVLVQGVHFRTDWSSAHDIGRKSVAANLADIFAMGGQPKSLLIGLAVPADTKVAWVLELAEGIKFEADLVGAQVIGGDVVRSEQIVISVTALGSLVAPAPITRSGAQVGDVLAVAGRLGYAHAGLLMLSRGFRSPKAIVSAHRVPEPPYALAQLAHSATSMIDISDGLLSDVGHIAQASEVAINIESQKLVVTDELQAMASAFNGNAMDWILQGGEDHAFAATFAAASTVPPGWVVIGSVIAGAGVTVDGEIVALAGWDHFK
ncbi:MAG: thiamine-phosphate kinase [Actinobacteria bacterium]|nr:thiamine-phosphate kinase [Actinomycetota bacterium]